MRVTVAKSAGFCFGVERAVRMCEEAAAAYPLCFTYGEIIHNKNVTSDFERRGVSVARDIEDIPENAAVVIRSHGVSKAEYSAMKSRKLTIIDATCPLVEKIHRIVTEAEAAGRIPVIIGKKEHAEVRGAAGQSGKSVVFDDTDELNDWLASGENNREPLSVVFQTTLRNEIFNKACEILKKVCTNLEIFDTICAATQLRYTEARELAEASGIMVVIGDRQSANSKGLFEIAKNHCKQSYFIENAEELPDFSGVPRDTAAGITAGASTPAHIIKEVNHKMLEEAGIILDETVAEPISDAETVLAPAEPVSVVDTEAVQQAEPIEPETPVQNNDFPEELPAEEETAETPHQETFEEMLEKSIKTLHTGDKVTGIVAAILPTEVSVDLGTKQSGYIPLSELTDEPDKKPEDIVKVGEEVEAFVIRVNDVEGTVQLSRRRLDAVKNWAYIETVMKDRTIVEGIVTEENKGGVVVMIRGIRVFIPASRTGLPRETPLSGLLKKQVRLLITEVNQPRRRVVGSISAVFNEERKQKAERVWSEIAVGNRYTGVVKSMTSYGAFVDIGGVDGMVHVSELSWARIRQPSDILNVGDTLDVYVISFDPEKRKISLGCKDHSQNPWKLFTDAYQVGSVAAVKIVKLMKYGAFAEILPGVDGLIHVSQVTDHRIGEPSDVLKEGDVVDVLITDIDNEKQKISLSIRALMSQNFNTANGAEDDTPEVVYDTDTPEAYEDAGEQS